MDLFLPLIAVAGMVATMATYRALAAPSLADRYAQYAEAGAVAAQASWFSTWPGAVVQAVAPALTRWLPAAYLDRQRGFLKKAGLYGTIYLHGLLVAQAGLALVSFLVVMGLTGGRAPWACPVAAGIGWLVPGLVVGQLVRRRQAELNSSLPDGIDLLTASVEAGLGLDAAIAQLARRPSRSSRALNAELGRYLQELQLGTARGVALRNLGSRAGVEDMRHVVTALIHGDALGVGVSQILRAQAQHLRQRRRQRAEEKAMQAPIKILFPLLFGLFPSIFLIILGPAVLRLLDTFIGKFQ